MFYQQMKTEEQKQSKCKMYFYLISHKFVSDIKYRTVSKEWKKKYKI